MKLLSKILKNKNAFSQSKDEAFKLELEALQLRILRIQQGIWHSKSRAIIVFEGFDASGKGGAIRKLIRTLDPRGFRVHSIGAPDSKEQKTHWQYRFWKALPAPGTIAIFDRSWYGRVLVERVENLTEKKRWKEAFEEINQWEKTLQNDGIEIIKIFLAITKEEQFLRFDQRLSDPYKQWKLTKDDIRSRKKWDEYVAAVDEMLKKTSVSSVPWHVVPANNKNYARKEVLKIVCKQLKKQEFRMKKLVKKFEKRNLADVLKELKH